MQLKNEDPFFQAVFENKGTGMAIIEEDTTFSRVNRAFENMFGYPREEVERKMNWNDFAASENDLKRFEDFHNLNEQNAETGPEELKARMLLKDGRVKVFKVFPEIVPGTGKYIASFLDISKRTDYEKFFNYILDSIDSLLILLDSQCRIVLSNRKDFHRPPENLRESKPYCYKVLKNLDNPCEDCQALMTFRDGRPRRKEEQNFVDGREREISITPVFDENGKVEYVLEHFRDITERRQTEEALRQSEKKFRNIFHNSGDAIFIISLSGHLLEANEVTCRRLGYTREELLGMNTKDIDAYGSRSVIQQRIQTLKVDGPNIFETAHRKKEGGTLPVEVSARKIEYQGRTCILSIARDITERKQAEKEKEKLQTQLRQSQKMEAIGTLAGGIAHDFNNILSSVIGYTELSLDEIEKDSIVHRNLSHVLSAGNRAKDLIKQILILSRQEDKEFNPTPLVPLVKETLKMLRSTFPASIEIRENIYTEQAVVHANSTQLHQVLINLATNAQHAIGDQRGVLEVSVETLSFDQNIISKYPDILPGDYALLSVSDSGSGISEENLNKIFEPYFTTKQKERGTGLGLSIVHGILKDHKGHINVSSEPGKGSTFNIYLPLIREGQSDLPTREAEQVPTGNESVLLVDDEKQVLEIHRQMLEKLGYNVTPETSGREALERFRSNLENYDIVITDLAMPDISGDNLAGSLKKIRPDIPVILCTGFSEKFKTCEKESGIDEILIKPIGKSEMAKAVRKTVDKK